MAYGDVKHSGGRGWGGGGSYDYYDDEGRGHSQNIYEQFVSLYAKTTPNLFDPDIMPESFLDRLVSDTRDRYTLEDFCDHPLWGDGGDGRIARLVRKHSGEDNWLKFLDRVREAWDSRKDREWMMSFYNAMKRKERNQQWELEAEEARKAQQVKLEQQTEAIRKEVSLTKGALQSDFHQVLTYKETYDQPEGEWLDDPVEMMITGYGWGEEVRRSGGVKIQVTVSLDLSNSMWYNKIHEAAGEAYRNICLALEELKAENQGSLFTAYFTFSQDTSEWSRYSYQDLPRLGRLAKRVKASKWDSNRDSEHYLGVMEQFREVGHYTFDGTDTWITPLFEEIEKWENEESDPGCARLDLIITDAVLEHPKDIREASVVQERRDGALQTIMLNLMDESEWEDSTLPLRCIQWAADKDNLAGMLRQVLIEFTGLYL
jgi:hypothetical protein